MIFTQGSRITGGGDGHNSEIRSFTSIVPEFSQALPAGRKSCSPRPDGDRPYHESDVEEEE